MRRVPTGMLDHELRCWLDQSEPVPPVLVQGFRYDLTAKAWQPTSPALAVQAQYVGRLIEVLTDVAHDAP
jgi:hypothetical protein